MICLLMIVAIQFRGLFNGLTANPNSEPWIVRNLGTVAWKGWEMNIKFEQKAWTEQIQLFFFFASLDAGAIDRNGQARNLSRAPQLSDVVSPAPEETL